MGNMEIVRGILQVTTEDFWHLTVDTLVSKNIPLLSFFNLESLNILAEVSISQGFISTFPMIF
jgi:hypothetical protein